MGCLGQVRVPPGSPHWPLHLLTAPLPLTAGPQPIFCASILMTCLGILPGLPLLVGKMLLTCLLTQAC